MDEIRHRSETLERFDSPANTNKHWFKHGLISWAFRPSTGRSLSSSDALPFNPDPTRPPTPESSLRPMGRVLDAICPGHQQRGAPERHRARLRQPHRHMANGSRSRGWTKNTWRPAAIRFLLCVFLLGCGCSFLVGLPYLTSASSG